MAESEGMIFYGATLKFGATTLAELVSGNAPEVSVGDVDFTHTTSPDTHEEIKPGLVRTAPGSFTCNWNPADHAVLHAAALARTVATAEFTLPDGSKLSRTNCWIKSVKVEGGGPEDKVMLNFEIRGPGKWTLTAAA